MSGYQDDFTRRIRSLVRGLYYEQIDFFSFVDGMVNAIQAGYRQAWREGAERCGVSESERTAEEETKLIQTMNTDFAYVPGLGDYIVKVRTRDDLKLESAYARARIWTNRFNAVATMAQTMACADRKLKWILGPTEEHCSDCGYYAGRVHRASVWADAGAMPQSQWLECRGYNCQCQLVETDEPALPGRPRMPGGR